MKGKIKESRQFQWLLGKKGTQVIIMKSGEKSRALDWYWEIWRELGGELPGRMDIVAPSLSTTVRLIIPRPEGGGEEGNKTIARQLNRENTIKTCRTMLKDVIDIDELIDQRPDHGENFALELAWKATDGTLDWISCDTTVQGKRRDWSILAGIARAQVGYISIKLTVGRESRADTTIAPGKSPAAISPFGRWHASRRTSRRRGLPDPTQHFLRQRKHVRLYSRWQYLCLVRKPWQPAHPTGTRRIDASRPLSRSPQILFRARTSSDGCLHRAMYRMPRLSGYQIDTTGHGEIIRSRHT